MGSCVSTVQHEGSTVRGIQQKNLEPETEPRDYNSRISEESNEDPVSLVQQGVLGQRHPIDTPFGQRELVYADYTASGRFLTQLEDFFNDKIAPLYANTHTEASATGAQTTILREEARLIIAQNVNAPAHKYATLFVGTGCSGALEKMMKVLGISLPKYADKKWNLSNHIPEEERPVVFIGPFEHHSNELAWRESICTVEVIPEDKDGCPDLEVLEQLLIKYQDRSVKIGSFSAGSNVTGIRIDTRQYSKLLHKYNALAFFDFAGSGAYVAINVGGDSEEESMDGIYMSPHKFIGGPGCTGILIAKRNLFDGAFGIETKTPTFAGGGTVSFVGPHGQDYEESIEAREDAGTPGIVQAIRTGLAFQVKQMVGSDRIEMIERHHCDMVLDQLRYDKNISLTGCDRLAYFDSKRRVPIFSFNVMSPFDAEYESARSLKLQSAIKESEPEDEEVIGRSSKRSSMRSSINASAVSYLNLMDNIQDNENTLGTKMMFHPGFVVSILNDVYGIQARAGCSCAGPYGHRLFGMEDADHPFPKEIRELTQRGYHVFKPGWARVNFNYFISDEEVTFICDAIKQIGEHGWKLLPFYVQEPLSGLYIHRGAKVESESGETAMVSLADLTLLPKPKATSMNPAQRTEEDFASVLKDAERIYRAAEKVIRTAIVENKNGDEIDIPIFTESLPKDIDHDKIWWATSLDVIEYINHHDDILSSSELNKKDDSIKGIDDVENVFEKKDMRSKFNTMNSKSFLLKMDGALLRSSRKLSIQPIPEKDLSIGASFRSSGMDRASLFGSVYLAENPNMRSRG